MRKFGIAAIALLLLASCGVCAATPGVYELVPLQRADGSGVYALPAGARVQDILLDGRPANYVLVKDGTEVDVWDAQPASRVEALIER